LPPARTPDASLIACNYGRVTPGNELGGFATYWMCWRTREDLVVRTTLQWLKFGGNVKVNEFGMRNSSESTRIGWLGLGQLPAMQLRSDPGQVPIWAAFVSGGTDHLSSDPHNGYCTRPAGTSRRGAGRLLGRAPEPADTWNPMPQISAWDAHEGIGSP
jgi:hypothetical protein